MSVAAPRAPVPARFPLALLPTPLVPAARLTDALGCGPLLVKRDDLIGFGVAGNKARPLEYLLGAALRQGARVVVTGGGPGSNFCAAAALAARIAGLRCEIVLWGELDGAPNVALARAAGARIIATGRADRAEVDLLAARRAAELTGSGVPAVAVPRGGSTPVGALGFAEAAAELAVQLSTVDRVPAGIVLPVGSGGSCAGLLVGLAEAGLDIPVVGVSVSRPPASIRETVRELATQCAALRGSPPPGSDRLELVDARGEGFGRLTEKERRCAQLARDTEGLLLDATYGAKAFTVVVDRLRGEPPGGLVWWHTGGLVPAVAQAVAGSDRRTARPADEGAAG